MVQPAPPSAEQNGFVRNERRKSFFSKKPSAPSEPRVFSRVLPGPERIHQSVLVDSPIVGTSEPTVQTLYDALLRGARVSKNGDLVGERRDELNGAYGWLKYETVIKNAQFIGSALIQLGASVGQETRVGVAGFHSPNYLTATFSLVSYSMVCVPLYVNSNFGDLKEIVNKCRLEILFCDTYERALEFAYAAHETPSLKHVILLRRESRVPNGLVESTNVNLFDWPHALRVGKEATIPVQPPAPTDCFVIIHTSGTTGTPKGAIISHRSLLTTAFAAIVQWFSPPNEMRVGRGDTYFSFLSPAHLYEQIMQVVAIYSGARIGVYGGNIANLLNDMRVLQPTFTAFVPRLLSKLKAEIEAGIKRKNKLVQKLFEAAIKSKTRDQLNGKLTYTTVWDRTLFRPIHRLLGGRLRFVITGGAPILPQVKYFSRCVFGCPLFEGYGQTESSAAATLTMADDTTVGHVGVPAPWVQIKLVSVPELGYAAEEDSGEVLIRGAGVMDGYFEAPELTRETVDADGWLHTGDIGVWQPDGTLRIVDRKKHFFKLAQGDYVSSEQIEAVYSNHPLVAQIFVDGRSTESFLVAILVPNTNELRALIEADEKLKPLLASGSLEEAMKKPEVRRLAVGKLREFGRSNGLNSLQQIRNLHFETDEFSTANGLLTPTLKMKRVQIRRKYEAGIDALYGEEPV
ncbi:AMP-dependent synthetase ligase domain containing protein [Aphelenchoides fujianensis]|nr:AMP-dependent synthetase ligase domain containing protein [Aphelenchoides fujianensis]